MVKKQKIPTLRCDHSLLVCVLSHNKIIRDLAGLLVYASILKVLQRESPSSADETRKTAENTRRRPTKYRKCRKTLIVDRRNAEIAEKCSLSVDETQKSQKNARCRSTKCRICRKSFVIHG